MSKIEFLRAFVNQRLTAAAEEIFGLFERTIAEYEEELSRSKEENERQQKLLDAVIIPRGRIHEADIQQPLVVKVEVPPEQQEWSSSLDQEDPEPPHIKEEQEELWTSQEGEQLQGLEEADIKFTFTPVTVKSEDDDDEEKPQSSQLHQRQGVQMKTEADGEDCGGPEPGRISDPDSPLQPDTDDKTSPSSEPETDDSRDWEETKEPQSGSNSLQSNEVHVMEYNTGKTSVSSSECAGRFDQRGHQQKHTGVQTGEKPFSCLVCHKRFSLKQNLTRHLTLHTSEKTFSCSVCNKNFTQQSDLRRHWTVHTGEKPFSCSVCNKRFTQHGDMRRHETLHTGEKPFSCSVCSKTFAQKKTLMQHMFVHTGEKPFSCAACGKNFTQKGHLRRHWTVHTGEKPFSCSVCHKRFSQHGDVRRHAAVHIEEK